MLDTVESVVKIFFYIASGSAAWFASFTWSRELKGKAKHDVAKELLVLVIQIRSFLTASQHQSSGVSSRKNIIKRYDWIMNYFSKTSILCTEVQVHFKNDEHELINELLKVLVELNIMVGSYDPQDLLEGDNIERAKLNLESIRGNNAEFNSSVKTILFNIESKFKKYV